MKKRRTYSAPKSFDSAFLSKIEDIHTRLSFFLLDETGTTGGLWSGKMTAAQQKVLFGKNLGQKVLTINGFNNTLTLGWSVGFGQDYESRTYTWADIPRLGKHGIE